MTKKDPNLKRCKICGIPLNREIVSEKDPDICRYCAEEKGEAGEMGHMPPVSSA